MSVDGSPIEWTDATWNCVRGCSVVSPGCVNCFAKRQAHRFSGPGGPYEGMTRLTNHGPEWTGVVRLIPELLDQPLRWKRPRRIFVNSMSDLFHQSLPDEAIDQVFAVMALAKHHTFQVLTKRADRMHAYLSAPRRGLTIRGRAWELLGHLPKFNHQGILERPWPLPNVWLIPSVENQATADERIPLVLQTPAAVRGISVEPLLEGLDIARYLKPTLVTTDGRRLQHRDPAIPDTGGTWEFGLDWVIGGFESGPGARPGHLDWARSLRDQVVAVGKAFFWKQNGEYLPVEGLDNGDGGVRFVPPISLDGIGSIKRWDGEAFRSGAKDELAKSFFRPGTFAVKVGKKRAGRLLDGIEWSQFPEVSR